MASSQPPALPWGRHSPAASPSRHARAPTAEPALLNPRPRLACTAVGLSLGDALEVAWQFDGEGDDGEALTEKRWCPCLLDSSSEPGTLLYQLRYGASELHDEETRTVAFFTSCRLLDLAEFASSADEADATLLFRKAGSLVVPGPDEEPGADLDALEVSDGEEEMDEDAWFAAAQTEVQAMPIQRQQELALGLNRLQGFVAGLVERAQQRATDRAAVSGGLVEVSPEDVAAVQAEMLEEEALRRRAAQ